MSRKYGTSMVTHKRRRPPKPLTDAQLVAQAQRNTTANAKKTPIVGAALTSRERRALLRGDTG